MRITLACNLGMSTSLLIEKLKTTATARGIKLDVDAVPFDKVNLIASKTDVLLLGPQIRYLVPKFTEQFGSMIPVIEAMNMQDYALLKSEKILDEAIASYTAKTGKAPV